MKTPLWTNRPYSSRFASLLIALALVGLPLIAWGADSTPLQFSSGGHILGFTADGYYAAAPSHVVHVQFCSANFVAPVAAGSAERDGRLPAFGLVRYPGLWDGITVTYDAPADGILRSTFAIEPGADPTEIHFAYDAALALASDGALIAAYDRGNVRESAPIAWQEVAGVLVSVPVAFELRGASEVGFTLGCYDPALPLLIDPVTSWSTFLGGSGDDFGNAIHVDPAGTIVVLGSSDGTWGTPLLPFSDAYDISVAKLDAGGNLLWNTFIGGDFDEYGTGLAVAADGSIFIAGLAEGLWNAGPAPVNPYNDVDGYVAKLTSSGNLVWRTFTGGNGSETCTGIALTGSNVVVTGFSDQGWGSPLNGHAGGADDGFVMMLNANGARLWSTFIGGGGADTGERIAVDDNGDIYVAGTSDAAWGPAIRAYTALNDGFVAKLSSIGSLSWNTFLGGSGNDLGSSVIANGGDHIYVAGASSATWATPVRPYSASIGDGYAAKLETFGGTLLWNTFVGGAGDDSIREIAEDGNGNLFVVGTSSAQWGAPAQGYAGGANDVFVARLASTGAVAVNTFLGCSLGDQAGALALDPAASVLALGRSNDSWGAPIRPYTTFPGNNYDAFVAMVDIAAPTALSFTLDTPATSPTHADELVFRVTFSEAVLGVGTADFVASNTTAMISSVFAIGPSEYTVTAAGGDLAGSNNIVGLDFAATATVADLAGNTLVPAEPPVDDTYAMDNIAPVAFIDLPTPADPTASADATFYFSSDDPTAVFEGSLDGGPFLPITSPYDTFGLSDGFHTFTLYAIDEAVNVGTASFSWTIDLVPPMVDSIIRADPNPTSEPIVDFTVLFTEPVTGVGIANFALATTGVAGAAITGVSGAATSYAVTVDTGTGVGTIRLDLAAIGAIVDAVGNPLAGTFTTGEFYTIVPPEPQFQRGDANSDASMNIADAVFVLDHLFSQGAAPACRDTADANDDGLLNIADPVKILDYLFAGGPQPPAPFGACGVDPTADGLDCGAYLFCQP